MLMMKEGREKMMVEAGGRRGGLTKCLERRLMGGEGRNKTITSIGNVPCEDRQSGGTLWRLVVEKSLEFMYRLSMISPCSAVSGILSTRPQRPDPPV